MTPEEQKEMEKALCCICNGNGIVDGANPMCLDHYKSEVIDKSKANQAEESAMGELGEDAQHKGNMSLSVQYDSDKKVFIKRYMEGDQVILQLCLTPESFESLANDMLKAVKEYNLMQAKEYMEKRDGNRLPVQDPACTDCKCEGKPE